MSDKSKIRIVLPSKGRLRNSALRLLEDAGFDVNIASERQYRAKTSDPNVEIMFYNAKDIPKLVRDGSVDLGITGWDLINECGVQDDVLDLVDLDFGRCWLALAAPTSLHINSLKDLYEMSMDATLRIATSYPNLTRDYLMRYGINRIEVIEVSGAVESLPLAGEAHIISDLVSTGITLTSNNLGVIKNGGIILKSTARLIGNPDSMKDQSKRDKIIEVIDGFEGAIYAKNLCEVKASIKIEDIKKIENLLNTRMCNVIKDKKEAYLNAVIEKNQLSHTIKLLRGFDCSGIVVTSVKYYFKKECKAVKELKQKGFF